MSTFASAAPARSLRHVAHVGWALALLHVVAPPLTRAQVEGPGALAPATPPGVDAPEAADNPDSEDPGLPPPYAPDASLGPVPPVPPAYAPDAPREGTTVEVPQPGIRLRPLGDEPTGGTPTRRERRRQRWAPERRAGHRIGLDAMAFGGDIDGAAFAADWRFRAQRAFFSLVRVGPLALGKAGGDRIGVVDASFVLGFDTRLFAVGAGAGFAYLRIEDGSRRLQGLASIGRLHLRGGALDGLHAQLDVGAALVDDEVVVTHANLALRFPLRRHRLFDVVFEVMEAASWVQLQAGLILRIPGLPESPWRVRPHVGVVEIIDAIGRDGGPALAAGVQLMYLGDRE